MPDGKSFFTRCSDGKLRSFFSGPGRGEALPAPVDPPGKVVRVLLSPDGKILLTSEGRSMKFLGPERAAVCAAETPAHQGDVFNVIFSPDGRLVAEAGRTGVVQVWESPKGKAHLSAIVQPDAVGGPGLQSRRQPAGHGWRREDCAPWDTGSGRQSAPAMPHQGWINELHFATKDDSLFSGQQGPQRAGLVRARPALGPAALPSLARPAVDLLAERRTASPP